MLLDVEFYTISFFRKAEGKMQSIGADLSQASSVFILPAPPQGKYLLNEDLCLSQVEVSNLIEQEGNHWRKILTIMAKLSVKNTNWRKYRDECLLRHNERIEFALPATFRREVTYFICGQTMQSGLELEEKSICFLNEKRTLAVYNNIILCPYLDYRQYSNKDIDVTRAYLDEAHLMK